MKKALILVTGIAMVAGSAWAARLKPTPVSPGDAVRFVEVSGGCPTFSWAAAPGAKAQRLIVHRVTGRSAAKASDLQEILRVTLPGSASSWTPSNAQCLDGGNQYAWSVAAVSAKGSGKPAWSDPIFFRVAPEPKEIERTRAVEPVRAVAAAEQTPAQDQGKSAAEAAPEAQAKVGTNLVGATQMTVDGRIEATSFKGDGSELTDLPPQPVADGSITEAKLAPGAVTNAKIGAGAVSADKIQLPLPAHSPPAGSVGTNELADGAVTSSKLGDNSVNGSKVQDGSLTGNDIADASIPASKLQATPATVCQRPVHGGSVLDEKEPNSTSGEATPMCEMHGLGGIAPIGDLDLWSDKANANDLVFAYVSTRYASTSSDSVLRVLDNDGTTELARDDDDGDWNTQSSAVAGIKVVQGGTVYYEVREEDNFTQTGTLQPGNSFMYPYDMYATVLRCNPPTGTHPCATSTDSDFQNEQEANGSTGTANRILKHGIQGEVPTTDQDYWQFFAREGDWILAICDDDPDKDANLTFSAIDILNSGGASVDSGDNDSSHDANTVGPYRALASGRYYFRMDNTGGGGQDFDYRCVVKVFPNR